MEKDLKDSIEDLLKLTESLPASHDESIKNALYYSKKVLNTIKANKFKDDQLSFNLIPFLWFLKIEDARITTRVLHYLEKFHSFNYYGNDKNYYLLDSDLGEEFNEPFILEELIRLACNCYKYNDFGVHQNIIKFIVKISSHNNYNNIYLLHKNQLVVALRTLIRIHVLSSETEIQTSARNGISIIVNATFNRFLTLNSEIKVIKSVFYKPTLNTLSGLLTNQEKFVMNEALYSQVFACSELQLDCLVVLKPTRITIFLRDALLVFRTLSKVALKDNRKIEDQENETKARHLALTMIGNILEINGNFIMRDKHFLHILQKYVCAGLVKNLLQPQAHLFSKALHVVSTFTSKNLSIELSFLVNDVLLVLLESKVCPVRNKILVVNTLDKLLSQPEVLLRFFIQNDCSLGKQNVFEKIIATLTAITCKTINHEVKKHFEQSETSAAYALVADIRKLHKSCIKLLSVILKSMSSILVQHSYRVDNNEEKVHSKRKKSPIQNFTKKQKEKYDIAQASAKFMLKPKLGIAYLINEGYISDDEQQNSLDIAKSLFQYSDKLSKTQIGEYLGGEKEKQLEVMNRYVELFNFESLDFDIALRRFLSKFRLPGEAQKIDRLMEKFAAVYCEQNEGLFPTADTAFILAYSIIMLNTDAHNPNIKPEKKMKKDDFINLNRGIAGGRDLNKSFLEGIYDNITQNAISLKEDDDKRAKQQELGKSHSSLPRFFSSVNSFTEEEKKGIQYSKQIADLASDLQAKLSIEVHAGTISLEEYNESENVDYVALMLSSMHTSLCTIFSLNLQVNSDLSLIQDSVSMFCSSIKLLNRLGTNKRLGNMEEIRDIRNLQFNLLVRSARLNKIHVLTNKDLICIAEVTHLITDDQLLLSTCWTQAVMHISNLVEFDVSREGGHISLTSHYAQNTILIGNVVNYEKLDRLFMSSYNLSDNDLCLLFKGLKTVAYIELNIEDLLLSHGDIYDKSELVISPFTQRQTHFCLQKIIEVAEINLGTRSRMLWAQIWENLYKFFMVAATHSDEKISLFVLDSLRQLSIKFIVKDEHVGFSFQAKFLKPFQLIFLNSKNQKKLIYILNCLQYLLQARGKNIKSGWKVYLAVLQHSTKLATHLNTAQFAQLLQVSSNLLKNICMLYLDQVCSNSETYFELLKCIDAFFWLNYAGSIHLRKMCVDVFYSKALSFGLSLERPDMKVKTVQHFVQLFSFPQKNLRITHIRMLGENLWLQRQNIPEAVAIEIVKECFIPLFYEYLYSCNALTEAAFLIAKRMTAHAKDSKISVTISLLFDENQLENDTTFSAIIESATAFAFSYNSEVTVVWMDFLALIFSNQPLIFFEDEGLSKVRLIQRTCLSVLENILESRNTTNQELGISLSTTLAELTYPSVLGCFALKGDTFMLKTKLRQSGYLDNFNESVVFYLSDFNLHLLNLFTKNVTSNISEDLTLRLASVLLRIVTRAFDFNKRLKLRKMLEEEGFLIINHYLGANEQSKRKLRRDSTASAISAFSSASNTGSEIKVASVLEEYSVSLPPGLFKQELAAYKALTTIFKTTPEFVEKAIFQETVSNMFLRFIKSDKYVYMLSTQICNTKSALKVETSQYQLSLIKYKESRLIKRKLLPLVIEILKILLSLDLTIVKNLSWFYTEATNLVQVENRDVRALVLPLLSIFSK